MHRDFGPLWGVGGGGGENMSDASFSTKYQLLIRALLLREKFAMDKMEKNKKMENNDVYSGH